jgi:hypothetical protein
MNPPKVVVDVVVFWAAVVVVAEVLVVVVVGNTQYDMVYARPHWHMPPKVSMQQPPFSSLEPQNGR